MTIAAAYLVSEGVVFGADSTTTITVGTGGVAQLFNHAQKVFEVGPGQGGRLGLCTWGAGSIGDVAHRTIAARLADRVTETTTVEQAADALDALLNEELARQPPNSIRDFGCFLGGVDPVTRNPACFRIRFAGGKASRDALRVGQALFQGAPQLFARVYQGYDPGLRPKLLNELRSRIGGAVADLDKVFSDAFDVAAADLVLAGYPNLPIREAVDFVHMYLHVTVKAFKFQFGPPICGGPLEIAFISTDRPFRWARHKPFDVAIKEPEAGA